MSLPDDLQRGLAKFADRERARTLLEPLLALPEGPRIARCVWWLAGRDDDALERLAHYATAARVDYRDVIWWAEYDGGETQLRDFTNPLP